MLEVYYWVWRLLGLGVVLALVYVGWHTLRAHGIVKPRKRDALARGLLNACRDHWEAGGTVVFRGRDGKERAVKRC